MADQPQQQQSTSSEPEKGELPGIRSRVSSRSPMSVEALPAQMESPSASSPSQRDEMMACVVALEAALLPCLPARELQAVDRSVHSSHQIDVERHAREFMEAAKKLQLYFISLQREDQPTREKMLRKEISAMEEELKSKSDLIKQQEKLVEEWRKELKEQLQRHITELERV
ncbi:mediator of RNA polymerase II transcription subunit 28-like [Zingiber officinale]|uniref:Mediator of RNA polymerase II transcription subunit 28 n=1 Tax=Zingiber officinale TaxID=94328 RepID=A0A8J5HZX0_ZINOF|nr:mediator of RNA polymerase II transcription subunit 28-like [Zingiber officinale]XP_042464257.1 mediator of RNA polymerase II transcription subunit 28-like [Zingiber officinale]KAG6535236.1 hypothetical protein ZIOFF_000201 [Zingiber officinale]